jgi:hypothetical protein
MGPSDERKPVGGTLRPFVCRFLTAREQNVWLLADISAKLKVNGVVYSYRMDL